MAGGLRVAELLHIEVDLHHMRRNAAESLHVVAPPESNKDLTNMSGYTLRREKVKYWCPRAEIEY